MSFSERFTTLIRICRSKNADIARGINADPSLVSRWRTGDRLPVHLIETADALGGYFSRLPLLSKDREQLLALLGLPDATAEALADAVSAYLKEDSLPRSSVMAEDFAGGLFGAFERILTCGDGGDLRGISFWPYVKKGTPAEHETFLGEEGQRRACFGFFHAVLSSTKPLDVYLLNTEGNGWIFNDASFSELWAKGLSAMARAGHRIHILLAGRETARASVEAYLPLMPHGDVEFFALKSGFSLAPTLFVARGLAATITYPGRERRNTLYFSHPSSCEVFFDLLSAYLENALPVFSFSSGKAYADTLVRFEGQPGPLSSLRNHFPFSFLSENALRTILAGKLPEPRLHETLALFSSRRAALLAKLRTDEVHDFVAASALLRMETADAYPLPGCDLLAGVSLTAADRALYLEELLSFTESTPNYLLAVIDEDSALNLLYGKEAGVLLTLRSPEPACPHIGVSDPLFLQSAGSYFSEMARRHGTRESRTKTAERLRDAVRFLKGDMEDSFLSV
ncbi:general secretion pathway protein GspK [Oscillospiraceae bacterium OttesenSCG-928-G22]|nr:general secretion pathway protein GspK [Oscillospiraceae bacterium OttesenSCG-928-G22]